MLDFEKMTVAKLREAAKSLGLSGYEKMKKPELLKLIMDKVNPGAEEKPQNPKSEKEAEPAKKEKTEKKDGGKKSGKAGKNQRGKKTADAEKGKEPNDRQFVKTGKKTLEVRESQEEYQTDSGRLSDVPAGVENFDELDSGRVTEGLLEIMPDGFGFLRSRSSNFLLSNDDIYVSSSMIKQNGLRPGDMVAGHVRIKNHEKFDALHSVTQVNGLPPETARKRRNFEELTPIFPNQRIHLERFGGTLAMRVTDLLAPIGKGQRGMIVSPPKAGKTTLLKDIATSVIHNHPEIHLIILLIDERPEEVTDIKESIVGDNVDVFYSTFDKEPDHHGKISQLAIERAKRLVEMGLDAMILLDSITRYSRANNLLVPPSGRTLSGGLDPTALYKPKKFFGAARNVREGGSLTILATALVETGSRMDDVVFEEFKGTGNMELVLDRKLSERRIFPAIDMLKSGTRRDDLLLTPEEYATIDAIRKAVTALKPEEATERLLDLFANTKNNREFLAFALKKFWN